MPVQFEFYENPVSPEQPQKTRYHARVVTTQTTSTETLIDSIHSSCTLHPSDLKAALAALSQEIGTRLSNGERVHIQGLGYFQITLSCPETRDPKDTRAQRVAFKSVKFRADNELKSRLTQVETQRARHVRHSTEISETEIDIRLTEFFQQSPLLTRRKFQDLCGLTAITAGRHITRLLAEEKLRNANTRYQPVYVPMPGYYGTFRV